MSEGTEQRAAFRQKTAELVVAAFIFALGAVVMWDSMRLGAKWGADGPEAGYFPFYIALILCIASGVNFVRALLDKSDKAFVQSGQLKLVLSVLVPSAIYVAVITWLGIYVSSIVFIAFFMRWLGKYDWWKLIAVSVGVSVVFYLIFEIWFKVPLPKGPLEAMVGLN